MLVMARSPIGQNRFFSAMRKLYGPDFVSDLFKFFRLWTSENCRLHNSLWRPFHRREFGYDRLPFQIGLPDSM
jgi:hypothetical protein